MQDLHLSNEAGRSVETKMNRRDFLYTLGAGGVLLGAFPQTIKPSSAAPAIKPISGSWFEFQHHGIAEGVDWNPQCARFTCQQWAARIKEIAEVGMEYLVLMATALYDRAFFPTQIVTGTAKLKG